MASNAISVLIYFNVLLSLSESILDPDEVINAGDMLYYISWSKKKIKKN